MYLRTCLVERVDGLIRHKAVGNVAVCQFDTSCQRLVSIGNVVMLLVAALYVVQNLQRFLVGCWFYLYLLETALKRTILLYTLAIFVECCSTNALYCASSQCWFHNVGSIHRAWSRTSSDYGVNLVDKHNHIRICFQFLHQRLESLFKLSAILCTSHNTRHVESVDALAKQHRACVTLFYQLCQSFYYCALTNTRLTNQYWVILLAATQYLYYALNLALAAHTWVELTLSSSLCEVGAKAIQNRSLRCSLLLLCGSSVLLIAASAAITTSSSLILLFFLIGQPNSVAHVANISLLGGKELVFCLVVCHTVLF